MSGIPQTMQAIKQAEPGGSLTLAEVPVPAPGAGEVLVHIAASPINPSDLAMLQGNYGISFDYPMTPGLEGSGQVVAAGAGLMPRFLMGKPVACAAATQGLWAEYAVVPTAQCLPLPKTVPLRAGAMAVVNPLTAFAFVEIARKAGHRSLVSTAAGGQLGAMIRARAGAAGITVINVVRGAAQVARLSEAGHPVLDMTAGDFDAELKETCRRYRCKLALDAVGGDLTFRLVEALPKGAEVLIYGGLAEEASTLNPGTMIFKEATVRGFWLTKWLARKNMVQMILIARQVMAGLQGGGFESHVARVLPLAEATDAPAIYAADMSAGKVLIAPGDLELGVEGG